MTLVIVFFLLTFVTVCGLTVPLLLPQTQDDYPKETNIALYREQLNEVAIDIDRGLITKTQAEALCTEIHRRILAAEDPHHRPVNPKTRKVLAFLLAVLIPPAAVFLYCILGSPELFK